MNVPTKHIRGRQEYKEQYGEVRHGMDRLRMMEGRKHPLADEAKVLEQLSLEAFKLMKMLNKEMKAKNG